MVFEFNSACRCFSPSSGPCELCWITTALVSVFHCHLAETESSRKLLGATQSSKKNELMKSGRGFLRNCSSQRNGKRRISAGSIRSVELSACWIATAKGIRLLQLGNVTASL